MEGAGGACAPCLAAATSYAELQGLIGLVYDGLLEDKPWNGLLDALRRQFGANYVSLTIRLPSAEDRGLVVFVGEARPHIHAIYSSSLYTVDPFVNLPRDTVVMLEELIDEREWLDSVIYRDFLEPLQVRYMMGADIRSDDGREREFRLRVSRPPQGRPFSETERALCGLLLPHLKRALRLYAHLDRVESACRLYVGTLERMGIGSILLDEDGAICRLNKVAEDILAAGDSLQLHNGLLEAISPRDDRRLWRLIRQATAGRRGMGLVEAIALDRGGQRGSLSVLVRSIPLTVSAEAGRAAAVELILRDSAHPALPSEPLLRQLYQLTPAEASLAVLLGEGLTLEESASRLGISRNTARTHLRAVFAKTGVKRQTALVQLLLCSVVALD
ncbi:helix-turn-helix transcriptional regulator [Pseudomonas sp. GCM10022188]|uniref:helix-turn-helix transcriptional regulator n=1 Tax=Pseudomonas TaxID=286 RepID=UPI001E372CC9|nr:helix-turn-helix transcriptional regulator [Pseudomonas oryzagri]MCC6076484.1 LuxR C-terminal-related transcriptional regulator [Pseudomonas oryzagri]